MGRGFNLGLPKAGLCLHAHPDTSAGRVGSSGLGRDEQAGLSEMAGLPGPWGPSHQALRPPAHLSLPTGAPSFSERLLSAAPQLWLLSILILPLGTWSRTVTSFSRDFTLAPLLLGEHPAAPKGGSPLTTVVVGGGGSVGEQGCTTDPLAHEDPLSAMAMGCPRVTLISRPARWDHPISQRRELRPREVNDLPKVTQQIIALVKVTDYLLPLPPL